MSSVNVLAGETGAGKKHKYWKSFSHPIILIVALRLAFLMQFIERRRRMFDFVVIEFQSRTLADRKRRPERKKNIQTMMRLAKITALIWVCALEIYSVPNADWQSEAREPKKKNRINSWVAVRVIVCLVNLEIMKSSNGISRIFSFSLIPEVSQLCDL